MKRYAIPNRHAYFDGKKYQCYKIECFIDNASMKEIDRISGNLSYTPILQCTGCGTTYFGVETRDYEAEAEITKHAEEVRSAEEERTKLAEEDNKESIKEIEHLEAEQEQALQEETDRHSAEEHGDIILPDILTF